MSTTPPASTDHDSTCANCGASASGKHCLHCGALAQPSRLTFRAVLSTTIEHFLSLDFPMLRTTIDLMRFPGRVAAEYVAGRRQKYANPLKFSLITGAILVAAVHYFDAEGGKINPESLKGMEGSPSADALKQATALAMQWINSYVHIIYFLSLPVLALAMRLLFPRAGRNLAEWYVLCLYSHGEIYLAQALCEVVGLPLEGKAIDLVLKNISGLSPFVLFIWAAVGFVAGNRVWSALKSLLVYFAFSFAIMTFMIAVAAVYLKLTQVPMH